MDYWWDVVADFRHLYHLSPAQALALPGPEFLALVWRMAALNGVVAARVAALQDREKTEPGRTETPSDLASLKASSAFGDMFD